MGSLTGAQAPTGSNIIEASDRIAKVRTVTRLLRRNGYCLCEKGKSWKADSLGFAWSESESRSWRRTITSNVSSTRRTWHMRESLLDPAHERFCGLGI
jgi:hypothetical protein